MAKTPERSREEDDGLTIVTGRTPTMGPISTLALPVCLQEISTGTGFSLMLREANCPDSQQFYRDAIPRATPSPCRGSDSWRGAPERLIRARPASMGEP